MLKDFYQAEKREEGIESEEIERRVLRGRGIERRVLRVKVDDNVAKVFNAGYSIV